MKSTATILSCIALWLYTAGAGAAANVKDPNAGWVIICGSGQAQVVSDGSCVSACPKGTNFTPGAIWPNRGGPSCIDPLHPPPPRPAATNARSPDPELSKAKKDPNGAWVNICRAGEMQVVSDGSCVSTCPKGTNFVSGAIWPNRGGPSCIGPLNPPPPRPAATNARSPDPELSEAKSQLVKCLDKAPNNVVNTNSGQFVAYCLRQLGW